MTSDNHHLAVGTYNCQHFKEDFYYFQEILKQCDIVLLQEHCLYKEQLHKILDMGNVLYHGTSPMDISVPLIGRPYGGCAIIWHDRLHAKFIPLECKSPRLCAGTMTLHNGLSALLINMYLPCDSRYLSASCHETMEVLDEALALVLNNPSEVTIVGGDFNSDFNRRSPQVASV